MLRPTLQLRDWRNWCLWLQQSGQKLISSLQSQMGQHRKVHMWNTQQKLKQSVMQHFNENPNLVKLGEKLDLRNEHFATQFNDTNPSPTNEREGITCIIVRQGNPIIVL